MRNLYTNNPILKSDSYKYAHYQVLPEGTTNLWSYTESRGDKPIVYFGMQYFIKKYLMDKITMEDIEQAEPLITAHGEPFNRAGFERIVKVHGGYAPLVIRSLPEGMVVPGGIPTSAAYTRDKEMAWLVNWWETLRIQKEWYGSNIATRSWRIRNALRPLAERTCDDPEAALSFMLHDFGFRGVSGEDAAALGGMGHLLSFMGTDTVAALAAAIDYYNAKGPVGFSIPATEHSIMSSYGPGEGEVNAVMKAIEKWGGANRMFAVVGDTYDYINFIDEVVGKRCKQAHLDRGGCMVTRPDSGEPEELAPMTCEIHGKNFGFRVNSKGYKVLPTNIIKGIWGDGMDEIAIIEQVMLPLVNKGWSIENFGIGMGGQLLQATTRDDGSWATKAASITINGEEKDIYKQPKTDSRKTSKRGRQAVISENGILKSVPLAGNDWQNLMRTTYDSGTLRIDEDYDVIRKRVMTGSLD